jgi:hypothetical protein
MRFSIEQNFLTDASGKPLGETPAVAYHVVDADTLEAALSSFLRDQQATVIGSVQKLAGAHAVATAQQARTVFTVHVAAGSDSFARPPAPPNTSADEESGDAGAPPRR